MSDELKCCPFCGGEARIYTTESRQSYRRAVVKCQQCRCELRAEGGGYHDFGEGKSEMEKRALSNEAAKSKAIAAWNRRATLTTHAVIVSDESTDCATGWCKCERCGESINPWANYCSNCGAEVER